MVHRWEFELLNANDSPIGTLDGVTGGGAELVAQSPLGGSGNLTLDKRQNIDWMSSRVRCWFSTGKARWAVGTYLLSAPREQHSEYGIVTHEVGLLTKMNIILEDTVTARYSLPAGTAIIAKVLDLIQSTGETRVAVTESDATLNSPLTWDAGTPKLTIINALLQAAGYWSLWCDGSGQFRVEPYANPADRAPAFRFEHGEKSLHFPDWSRERNMADVPNRFVAVGRGDEDTAPLVGVASNTDPGSPYSYPSRGRWIIATEEGVEAESQQVINQYAARRLRDLMDPVARLNVTHAMLDLNPNDVVQFIPEDGAERLATVQRMSMSFTFDTDIAAEWREVL